MSLAREQAVIQHAHHRRPLKRRQWGIDAPVAAMITFGLILSALTVTPTCIVTRYLSRYMALVFAVAFASFLIDNAVHTWQRHRSARQHRP